MTTRPLSATSRRWVTTRQKSNALPVTEADGTVVALRQRYDGHAKRAALIQRLFPVTYWQILKRAT